MKAIDMLHEKLLFVRRHILHDILPICSTFSPEHEIVDGLNVSNGLLMHAAAQSFQQFNLIACDLAIVFNWKLKSKLYAIFVVWHTTAPISLFRFCFLPHSIEITFHFVRIVAYSRYQILLHIQCVFVWIFIWNFENKRILNDRLQFPFCISKPLATKQQQSQCDWRKEFQSNNDDEIQRVYNCIGWQQLYPIKCFLPIWL